MMMVRRDFSPGCWRSGLILIHYATTATSQQLKTYAVHFLHRVYLKHASLALLCATVLPLAVI